MCAWSLAFHSSIVIIQLPSFVVLNNDKDLSQSRRWRKGGGGEAVKVKLVRRGGGGRRGV